MTLQFRLTEPAIRDIEQIADYMARESGLERADRFLTRLDAKFAKNRSVSQSWTTAQRNLTWTTQLSNGAVSRSLHLNESGRRYSSSSQRLSRSIYPIY